MDKINVLHLRSVFGTGGGPEKTILLSAELINKERFNVHVVYLRSKNDPVFSVGKRASAKDINYDEIEDNRRFDLGAVKKIAAFIDANKVDILHCHGYKTDFYGFYIKFLLKKKIKLITTVHGFLLKASFVVKLYHLIDKFVLRFFDCVIAVSESVKAELRQFFVPESEIKVIHNAIMASDYTKTGPGNLKKELNIPEDAFLVGTVGRISPEKGMDVFVKTALEVKKRVGEKKVFFVIAGDGPDYGKIRGLSEKLGLGDYLFFLGQRDDMKNIYSSLDVFLLTSFREGLSNVVLEAQSMEVPVVATKVSGVSDVISSGTNGLLCEVGDIDSLAKSVKKLIKNRGLAETIVKSGRKNIEDNFSFTSRMRKIEDIYEEMYF